MHPEALYYYEIPTPEPTLRPSPSPLHAFYALYSHPEALKLYTAYPTSKPSVAPSPEPTPRPIRATPKKSSLPIPTLSTIHIPSTPKPSQSKLNRVTSKLSESPTHSPIEWDYDPNICGGDSFDVVLFLDNSCGLDEDDCSDLLESVGDLIEDILNYPMIRVSTVLYGAKRKDIEILVDFDDIRLQIDDDKYERYIRRNGECAEGGDGDTNLYAAIKKTLPMLDRGKKTKLIIVSNCMDDFKVCKIAKKIHSHHVDSYIVNLYDSVDNVENGMKTKHEARHYLSCLTDAHLERICIGRGVEALDDVIEDCLMPKICN